MAEYVYKNGQLVPTAGKNKLDADLSDSSTNGVQNKVITKKINELNETLANISEYSTDEIAIGKWIDGKTLYRRVFSATFSSPSAKGWQYLSTDLTLSDVDFCTIRGVYDMSSSTSVNGEWITAPIFRYGDIGNTWFEVNASGVGICHEQTQTSYTRYVTRAIAIVEYTKS